MVIFLKKINEVLESERMHKILAWILSMYFILLCVETSKILPDSVNSILRAVDALVCYLFITEIIIRITVGGVNFFKNGWNIFDFIVVFASVLASSGVAAFRVLRILRVAEILEFSPHMKVVVKSIVNAIPLLFHVFIVLSVVFLMFSIAAHDMFCVAAPQYFSDLGKSAYSLAMVIIAGADLTDIIDAISKQHEYGYLFFITYMIVISFIVLNLFFGVVIDSLQKAVDSSNGKD